MNVVPRRTVNVKNLFRATVRERFFDFFCHMWGTVVHEKPHLTWYHEKICDELQAIAEPVFEGRPKDHDLIINVPPGMTKSTMASIMFPPWTWTRFPSARHIGATYASNLTFDLGRRSRDVVTSDLYQWAFPEIRLRDDQHGKGYFMNTLGGSVRRTTVGSVIIGEHAHFHEVDDPLDPAGVRSELATTAANLWLTETLPQRKVDQRLTPMVLVMQRLGKEDPTAALIKHAAAAKTNVRHIRLPATNDYGIEPAAWAAHYVDGMLDPVRLPRVVLDEKKLLGPFMYAGQYGQDPIPLGGGMFKIANLKYGAVPRPVDFVQYVRFWDKAATEAGGAFTVGVLMAKHKNGSFWILDVKRMQVATDERDRVIYLCAATDPEGTVIAVEDEGGSSGKDVALYTVRALSGYNVRMRRPTGSKALRADPLSGAINGGNMWLPSPPPPWVGPLIGEMEFFPNSKYKDQVDAASGAYRELTMQREAYAF